MASNAENLLSCPICLERFQDPRLLHCGHTFCLECLENYHQEARFYRMQIYCPTCRSSTQLPNGQVNSLPKDFRIGQFQDVIDQSEDKKKDQKSSCVLCKERNETREASRLCTDCKRDFCEQCALRHSTVPAFKQHNIISMPTGDMASLRYCGSHSNEMLMYNCVTCEQFVCSLCITDTHVTCDVHSITESLSKNHENLNKVFIPLVANEDTLNSYLRDYNITIHKLNETHDAIDHQARAAQAKIQKARQALQNSLASYEQEQVAKLMTSLSADGSVDAHSYQKLCSDIHSLTNSNDPWTVAMQSKDLVAKATNVNQSLDRLRKNKGTQDLQFMEFSPAQDSLELGSLNLATIDPIERDVYRGFGDDESHFANTPIGEPQKYPGPGQVECQVETSKRTEWNPVFSVKMEGSSIAQVNKPTDIAFASQDTIAVSDYGNSRYTPSFNAVTSVSNLRADSSFRFSTEGPTHTAYQPNITVSTPSGSNQLRPSCNASLVNGGSGFYNAHVSSSGEPVGNKRRLSNSPLPRPRPKGKRKRYSVPPSDIPQSDPQIRW